MSYADMIKRLKKKFRQLLFVSNYISITSLLQYYYPGISNKPLLGLKIKGIKFKIFVRRYSETDKTVLKYVFHEKNGRFHLPPANVKLPDNPIILDLGSNIGLTIAHFKNIYPQACITGYEMDIDNFAIAKKNCGKYENVSLNNAAVWINSGTITYRKDKTNDAFSVSTNKQESNANMIEVNSITIQEIIQKHSLDKIDYVKMDIEGAEKNIFRAQDLSWMQHVSFINIEIHQEEEMSVEEYIRILQSNGFKAWKDNKHWSAVLAQKLT